MRRALLAVLLAFAPGRGAAEVTVRVTDGRVDLTATVAPLADVLDRLARQTGMKVVYEGPAPRQPVTLSIQGRTPTEAVLTVLEGSGVNFALVGDERGAVQTLVLSGAPAASASPNAAASSPGTPSRSPAPLRRPFTGSPGAAPDMGEATLDEEVAIPDEPVEMADPASAGAPAGVVPPEQAAPPPGAVPPSLPTFSASPFTPQPQPFPPGGPPRPPSPPGNPPPEENPAPPTPPPG